MTPGGVPVRNCRAVGGNAPGACEDDRSAGMFTDVRSGAGARGDSLADVGSRSVRGARRGEGPLVGERPHRETNGRWAEPSRLHDPFGRRPPIRTAVSYGFERSGPFEGRSTRGKLGAPQSGRIERSGRPPIAGAVREASRFAALSSTDRQSEIEPWHGGGREALRPSHSSPSSSPGGGGAAGRKRVAGRPNIDVGSTTDGAEGTTRRDISTPSGEIRG